MNVHVLRGCAPAPLAHYLKALGLFRLVSEQRDPSARAFWKDDVFRLATTLDEEKLVNFVCDEFEPTPMLSPWNGGSGFYPKDAKSGIDAVAESKAARFVQYRGAIAAARGHVAGRSERPEDDEKAALLRAYQRECSERALDWFSAAVSLSREGMGRYPALLGTGGNDGRLDFTNNFMQRLVDLVDMETGMALPAGRSLARLAMFGAPERGLARGVAIGQFHPGGAGGANGTAGFDAGSLVNAWDFILMLEGAVVMRVAALRRLDGEELAQAAAPFAFRGLPSGYGSAAPEDDGGRGEQWLPLWSAPVTLAELRAVFGEARVVRGSSRAENALDAARAMAQLGTCRGVESFVRFGYMERNGQSNLAVPLGRIAVCESPVPRVRLLDEVDPWLDSLARAAGDSHAPGWMEQAVRRIRAVAFELCVTASPRAALWGDFLEELGAAEDGLLRSPRFVVAQRLRPLPRLSSRWLEASDDGTCEYRLARALASSRAPLRAGHKDEMGPIRAHCLPLDPGSQFHRWMASSESLRKDPRVLWNGSDLPRTLAAIVLRRIMEGSREGYEGIALEGTAYASLDDLGAFVEGRVDDARLARLSRGLMAVDPAKGYSPVADVRRRPAPLHALFRAANLDAGERTRRAVSSRGVSVRCDAQTVRLLVAGRIEDAGRLALLRLGAMGLRPKLRCIAGDARLALRIASSLAFPIEPDAVLRVLEAVIKPFDIQSVEVP